MASTTIHLLRHGEVQNPEGILYGRLPDYVLSERGQAMAQRVAGFLSATRKIDAVISSPLERAQQTAEPIAAAFDLEVQSDERLIEAHVTDVQAQGAWARQVRRAWAGRPGGRLPGRRRPSRAHASADRRAR